MIDDDVDDEKTAISRTPAMNPVDVDDETRVSTTRAGQVDDATVVRRGPVDDATVVRRGPVDDATVVRRGAPDDRTAIVDRSVTRARLHTSAPGRISGGRVAFTPSNDPSRYGVRHDARVIPEVVRTVIPAPAPTGQSRQLRDTSAIESSRHNSRRRGGLGLVFALVGSVLLVVIVAGLVVYILFVAEGM